MSNAGTNPTDLQIYLSMRRPKEEGGSPNDWEIVKYTYSSPLAIVVSNNFNSLNVLKKPFIETLLRHVDLHDYTNVCGANNYFRENNTIHFVVTGDPGCLVRVRQLNTVFLTSRLAISPAIFWADGNRNVGNWLTLTATLMNLDPSTIKVVGRRSRRLL